MSGIPVQNFENAEMERVCEKIKASGNGSRLAILITPWGEDDPNYYRVKHIFISAKIPSQVVRIFTLMSEARLKWSTSNIALQSFAKLGGKPWKVKPRHDRCLIFGIGQSHRKKHINGKYKSCED